MTPRRSAAVGAGASHLLPKASARSWRTAPGSHRRDLRAIWRAPQYSVFECRLSPAWLQALLGELLDVMESDEDPIGWNDQCGRFASPLGSANPRWDSPG